MWSSWSRLSLASHAHLASFTSRKHIKSIDRKSLIKNVEIRNRFVTAWHVNFSYLLDPLLFLFFISEVDIINDDDNLRSWRRPRSIFGMENFSPKILLCKCHKQMEKFCSQSATRKILQKLKLWRNTGGGGKKHVKMLTSKDKVAEMESKLQIEFRRGWEQQQQQQ